MGKNLSSCVIRHRGYLLKQHNNIQSLPLERYIPYLLIVRILLSVIIGLEVFSPLSPWLANTTEYIMYLITAILFIATREKYTKSNIDKPSFYLFIIFGGLLRFPFAEEVTFECSSFYILFLVTSYLLLRRIRQYNVEFPRFTVDKYKWIFISIICGALLSLMAALPFIIDFQNTSQTSTIMRNIKISIIIPFFLAVMNSMSHAAIHEEAIFRGFTFGYLRGLGINDNKILIFQAILFSIAHIRYINVPYTFWVMLPASGLLLGWLSLKTRSLVPCMIAHALYNGMRVLY